MECGIKRKLDCIAESPVLIYPCAEMQDERTKRMRLSVQMATAPAPDGHPMVPNWELPRGQPSSSSSHDMTSYSSHGLMETEGDEKDTEDDIPSTAEVLDSLRKVILWMSAQEDRDGNVGGYLQRLSEVEAYARSRQQFDAVSASHQRKITQYLVPRHNQ